MESKINGVAMINEHKANASFMFKIVITLIGYWLASTLAIIIYSMFFKISSSVLLVCLLFPTPLIWFSILVSIGLIYKWIENLTDYDKYKLWCVFIRDLTITMLATMLATLTTMELYQIEQPLSFGKFVALVGVFLIAGFIAVALLIGIYLKIIKKLKKIDKN